jgi:hypothetical protein
VKITINAVYFMVLFVVILMIINFADISRKLDRIEQQLAVCSALPASQREGGEGGGR